MKELIINPFKIKKATLLIKKIALILSKSNITYAVPYKHYILWLMFVFLFH